MAGHYQCFFLLTSSKFLDKKNLMKVRTEVYNFVKEFNIVGNFRECSAMSWLWIWLKENLVGQCAERSVFLKFAKKQKNKKWTNFQIFKRIRFSWKREKSWGTTSSSKISFFFRFFGSKSLDSRKRLILARVFRLSYWFVNKDADLCIQWSW